ncbi:MAG: hypothetical protein ACRC6I_12260 [Paracoccaceae bacterium]
MKALFKAALLALTLAAAPAFAGPIADADRAAVTERVDAFNTAFLGGDMAAVFDFMPPKIISSIATQSGMTEEALMAAMKEQIDMAMAMVTIDSFGMDMETASAETTPDGSRTYVLIPTFTEMTVEGAGKMRADGETLAFEDEGKWYLVRVDDPAQVQLLTAVYPEFTGVTFTPAAITPME